MNTDKPTARQAMVVLIICAAAFWLGSFSGAANKTYEIRPNVPVAYQNNTVAVLDAYERLMDKYMSMVQTNLHAMAGDLSQATRQLSAIDRKLDNLAIRIARIERGLNIQPAAPGTAPSTPGSN